MTQETVAAGAKVRVNGVETWYEVRGEGPAVLFMHGGLGGPGSTLVRHLTLPEDYLPGDRVRTVRYDRRSSGYSEYTLEECSLSDLAADARALLDHLGVERSIVIGDSMGGMIALQYALHYPGHVTALCLMETGSAMLARTDTAARLLVERARREGERAVFDAIKDDLRRNPPPGPPLGPPLEAAERLRSRATALLPALARLSDDELFTLWAGALRNQAALAGVDLTPRLGELAMPVCIIHGTADRVVPIAAGETLHAGIAHAQFHAIEGGEHGIFLWPQTQPILTDWVLSMTRAA